MHYARARALKRTRMRNPVVGTIGWAIENAEGVRWCVTEVLGFYRLVAGLLMDE